MINTITLTAAPLIPEAILIFFTVVSIAFVGFAFYKGLSGLWARSLFLLGLLAALMNPQLQEKQTDPINDKVLLVLDDSTSMTIGKRQNERDQAEQAIRAAYGATTDIKTIRVKTSPNNQGTKIETELAKALSDIDAREMAGIFLVTDGQTNNEGLNNENIAAIVPTGIPVHLLLTGDKTLIDRRLIVEQAPEFALVDKPVDLVVRVEDSDGQRRRANLVVRQDGLIVYARPIQTDVSWPIVLEAKRRGKVTLDVQVEALAGEKTLRNNRSTFSLNAVRDRLRVLLVSGEPHPGGRIWRSTLKSDAAVDLIQFTILRLPTSMDSAGANELALIPFPTKELFQDELHNFDLVIFDRYRLRGILTMPYLRNLADYVEQGGALFVTTGPEYSERFSLYSTALSPVLPAPPTGRMVEVGFKPSITPLGKRHPVLMGLPQSGGKDEQPKWGRWFRMNDAVALDGNVLMEGPEGRPLLVLSHEGKGRVAQLLSDHIWMWARDIENGGPHQELIRRIAHWLMKEPDLEEEAVKASADDMTITVESRSLMSEGGFITITGPEGKAQRVNLSNLGKGRSWAQLTVTTPGLYIVKDRGMETLVIAGESNPAEFLRPLTTDAILGSLAEQSGAGTFWLADGLPSFRAATTGTRFMGKGWATIAKRNAMRTTGLKQTPALPAWLIALILLSLGLLTWWRESR
jgi:hypothetical protein